MRRLMLVLVLHLAAGCVALPQVQNPVRAEDLLGRWQVDLRALPGDAPYYQELVITAVKGQTFSGRFYGAEVTQARINADWGAVRIAFVTADGSGAYHHAAVLRSGRLEGLTNATGRGFLSYWSAVKS